MLQTLIWPACCHFSYSMLLHGVGSNLEIWKFSVKHFWMLYSFGHVRATLLHRSMRTSSICYFKEPSNMLQHIATGWPNVCNMLCTTMLWCVAFKSCVRLANSFTTRSYNRLHYVALMKCCVRLAAPLLSEFYVSVSGRRWLINCTNYS